MDISPERPSDISQAGHLISRIRNGIIRIRRAGVPHEETVVVPACATFVLLDIAVKRAWPIWIPGIVLTAIYFVCGAWLGLAWRGLPVLRVLLRPVYIGTIAVLLYVLTHDEPVTKREGLHVAGEIVSAFGSVFYLGYFYAAMVRDVALRRFSSEKQRRRYLEYAAWRSYIWRLARNKEDENAASDRDMLVARLVRSCMDIKGLIALFSLLGSAVYWLWWLLKVIVPTSGT